MANDPHPTHTSFLRAHISEFWSGDLGLTLVNMALCVLIFVITPLREAGLHGRIVLDLAVLVLMISAALVVDQTRIATAFVVAVVLATAVVLSACLLYTSRCV